MSGHVSHPQSPKNCNLARVRLISKDSSLTARLHKPKISESSLGARQTQETNINLIESQLFAFHNVHALADRLLQAHLSRARYSRRLNAAFIKLAEGSFQPVDQNQKTLGFRLILIRQMYTMSSQNSGNLTRNSKSRPANELILIGY